MSDIITDADLKAALEHESQVGDDMFNESTNDTAGFQPEYQYEEPASKLGSTEEQLVSEEHTVVEKTVNQFIAMITTSQLEYLNTMKAVVDQKLAFNYDDRKSLALWNETCKEYLSEFADMQAGLESVVNRSNSDWRQYGEHDGKRITPLRTRIAKQQDDRRQLTGVDAVRHIQNLVFKTPPVSIPLYHTGIWVNVTAPKLRDWIDTLIAMNEDPVDMGRASRGAIFSTDTFMYVKRCLDSILPSIFGSSLGPLSPTDLLKVIDIRDINYLLTIMASMIHGKAFPYIQSCTFDPTKCTHVERYKLRLNKINWIDNNFFTEEQHRWMSNDSATRTVADLDKYKEMFSNEKRLIKLTDKLSVLLQFPTAATWLTSNAVFVNELVLAVEQTFGQDLDAAKRNAFIADKQTASTLRKYTAFVKEIITTDGGKQTIISGDSSVEETLSLLSENSDIIEAFIEGADEFIKTNLGTVVGVLNTECPKCKKHGVVKSGPLQRIIPLDPVMIFFTVQQFRYIRHQLANGFQITQDSE